MNLIIKTERTTYPEAEARKLSGVFGFQFFTSEFHPKAWFLKPAQIFPVDTRTRIEVATLEDLKRIATEWGPIEFDGETITIADRQH